MSASKHGNSGYKKKYKHKSGKYSEREQTSFSGDESIKQEIAHSSQNDIKTDIDEISNPLPTFPAAVESPIVVPHPAPAPVQFLGPSASYSHVIPHPSTSAHVAAYESKQSHPLLMFPHQQYQQHQQPARPPIEMASPQQKFLQQYMLATMNAISAAGGAQAVNQTPPSTAMVFSSLMKHINDFQLNK